MAVDRKLVEILCCPVTKVPVKLISRDKLATLNRHIENGDINRQDGSMVTAPLESALITEDGRIVYPIEDDIPVMLEDQGILARQVPGW
jgi:uncharacterized protein YbaR (Trm112 family)